MAKGLTAAGVYSRPNFVTLGLFNLHVINMTIQHKSIDFWLKEAVFIVCLILAVLVSLALATYQPSQGSPFNIGHHVVGSNLLGNTGTFIAGWCFELFGWASLIIPLSILAWGGSILIAPRISYKPWLLLAKLLAFLLTIASLGCLLTWHFQSELSNQNGGLLSLVLVDFVLYPLPATVASALCLVVFLFAGAFNLGFSWLKVSDLVGGWVLGLFSVTAQSAVSKSKALKPERIKREKPVKATKNPRSEPERNEPLMIEDDILLQGMESMYIDELELANDALSFEPAANNSKQAATIKSKEPEPIAKQRAVDPAINDVPFDLDTPIGVLLPDEFEKHEFEKHELDEPEFEVAPPVQVAKPVVNKSVDPSPAPKIPMPSEQAKAKSLRIEPLKSEQTSQQNFDFTPATRTAAQPLDSDEQSLPPLDILSEPVHNPNAGYTEEQLEQMSELLVAKLAEFGVRCEVEAVSPGPVITRFEIQPAPGVKVSKISNLAKDIARSMAMVSIRVVEVIPGKSVVGIEVPNQNRAIVSFKKLLGSDAFHRSQSPLTIGLGDDIAGESVVADLAKMPHLLVAGTTGSGKSVGVNAMIISMLYKATPKELRLILIDPKMLELSIYEGIPHLLTPVITDMNDAANGLRWSVAEMERRYKLMSKLGVRNIAGYNKKVQQAIDEGSPIPDPLWELDQHLDDITVPTLDTLPYVVVVIDEFADMMMIVGKKVEELIARIAQKARAAGIHLILATQRPSVDVITGLIKANVPTRLSFQVSSKIDSRTVLDQGGAEQLLGHGDMLFMPPGSNLPIRVHGAFVSDEDVHAVVESWKKKGSPNYINAITEGDYEDSGMLSGLVESDPDGEQDNLFDEAVAFVTSTGKVSISSVQRKLRIGYNRAARLVESMEAAGVVSKPEHNGSRKVLAPPPPDF